MATLQKYPIGIQTFSNIIEDGYTYVDKTGFIPELINAGKYLFLSRPRRFGKSLLLSTLHSYFEGDKRLFEGLAINSTDVEWICRPVIHIDLNAENYMLEDGLDKILDRILRYYERKYGVEVRENSLSGRFTFLLQHIYESTGKKVVILVDEYDKPLLGIEDKPELFNKNQATLKGFFGVLKSSDRHIHFAMLTGVARFNKVSVFSDLNNLRDISFERKFADICGWSHKELLENFTPGIEQLAEYNNISFEVAKTRMKRFYDGYLFAPEGDRLYNPFSVLNALASQSLKYYWFQTGTPTFLIKRIKDAKIKLSSLNESWTNEEQLLAIGVNDPNPVPLLFQTGYLTIGEAEGDAYRLQFPNKEVEIGFSRSLVPYFMPPLNDLNGAFSILEYRREIINGEPEKFMKRMEAMLKDIPYEQHNEALYQNAVYLLFTLMGADARVEEHTNIGRSDLVVRTGKYAYIFEFKYNGSAEKAMAQIKARDYSGKLSVDRRIVYLIGANFSTEKRGLENWIIEEIEK
ncbi:MAG: ATP-binding protein [Muribaculaceae bacterium]|nr:ATP-binding protein [Muribaculaceae bacterium]